MNAAFPVAENLPPKASPAQLESGVHLLRCGRFESKCKTLGASICRLK